MTASEARTSTLAWRHPLEPFQGAVSFASRLAALNGRLMPNLLREIGIRPNDIDRAKPDAISVLAHAGGADLDALLRDTPRRIVDERFRELAGERLHRLSIQRTFFRYCPHCIREDIEGVEGPAAARPWLRTEWTLSHVRSCARHGILLAAASPERRRFEAPDFNATMEEIVPGLADVAAGCPAVPPSAFQSWLVGRLRNGKDPDKWLDRLELHVAVSLCEGLGISALHPPKVKSGTLTETDRALAADEGFAIASDGPPGIEELLGRLNAAQDRTRGVWGPRDTFGYVYGIMAREVDDPAWAVPRDLVAGFAIRSMPLEPGTNVLGHIVERQLVHTIRSASKTSGAHARTIRRLFELEGHGIEGLEAGLMDHRITVSAEEVETTVRDLKGALSTPKVQKLTGFPLIWLRAVIAGGHLPTVTGSNDREFAKHRFTRSAVDGMLERMFAGAEPVDAETDDRVGLPKARHRSGSTMPKLLELVFDGSLRWKGRLAGAEGLDALLVDVAEILPLVRSEERGTGIGFLELLTFIPGLGKTSPKALVAAGVLETVEEFSPEARRMVPVVTRESAERFLATYVTLGELCQRSGLHHKQVRKRLRGAEVDELFKPETHGCFAYDRARVDRAAEWPSGEKGVQS